MAFESIDGVRYARSCLRCLRRVERQLERIQDEVTIVVIVHDFIDEHQVSRAMCNSVPMAYNAIPGSRCSWLNLHLVLEHLLVFVTEATEETGNLGNPGAPKNSIHTGYHEFTQCRVSDVVRAILEQPFNLLLES